MAGRRKQYAHEPIARGALAMRLRAANGPLHGVFTH
jgi:hypothetical protein